MGQLKPEASKRVRSEAATIQTSAHMEMPAWHIAPEPVVPQRKSHNLRL